VNEEIPSGAGNTHVTHGIIIQEANPENRTERERTSFSCTGEGTSFYVCSIAASSLLRNP